MTALKRKLNQPGLRWLKSYIAIVVAIVAVLLVYSIVIVNQVKKDTDITNGRFTSYYNSTIENRLKSIQDYTYTLAMDKNARNLNKYKDSVSINTTRALADAYDIVYSIRDFIQANGMIDDIMLYYPDGDQVIGKYGSLPSYAYFKTTNVAMDPQEDEYNLWMKNVINDKRNGYVTLINGSTGNEIYYFYWTTFSEDRSDQSKIIVKLSNDKLDDELRSLVKSGNYLFAALIDKEGNIFSKAPENTSFIGDDGKFVFDEKNNDYVKYETDSSTWSLRFVTIQDYGNAYNLVRTISYILIAGVLLSLAVGIVISTHYASRGRKAVDQIVKRFESKGGSDINQNEFDFISGQIDELLEKNRNAIEASVRQGKIIAFSFLRELLNRQTCTEKDVDQLCATYGIELENELYALMVLSKEDKSKENVDSNRILDMVRDNEKDDFAIYWTRFEDIGLDVFLCNFDALTKSPQARMIEFAKVVKDELGEGWSILLGNVMNSTSDINTEWHFILHDNFPEYEVSQARLTENEGLLAVKEFGDAIENENLTDAINMIPHLNRRFISCRNENLTRCRKYTIIGKLYESYFGERQSEEINLLMDNIDDPDWSRRLISVMQTVDRDLNQKTDLRQVAELAHEIIDEEYGNPQLGLHMIADRIGVSQSYLSRLFKQRYGIGVIKYLNFVRIEQAKKLMMTGTDNLQVIAINVGFLSDVTLIRVFKKYENTTPGSYRNKD